ncbi:GNAT family N-acetyltransferase [Microbacterium schleiferi]|uniref:GNAT family N-acetyltransferase n=1 Tax=Microbacterium schleiferi TaxID=69362 RepID=UPI001D1747E4|nr:GNAT family N-acetyltransferase [Microbacterium schleiferi]MCC4267793.1 GNAT family N-acetyltransferase [Microbacterium schleiferi]
MIPQPATAFSGIQTARLGLRELTPQDHSALHRVLGDEVAMSAYEHGFSPAETATWIEGQLRRYRDDGFGLWAVTDAETDEVIGDCGLTVQRTATAEVVEVGYHLLRQRWGLGYATEAASACLDWGFANVVVPEIYAIVRDTNLASMNVAIRLGMTVRERFVKHYRDIDMPHLAFAVSRAAWRSRHPSP